MNWNPTPPRPMAQDLTPSARQPSRPADPLPESFRRKLRPCRAMWLDSRGDVEELRLLVPAYPLFEAAFCAFSRGTLIATENGPTAIEDLLPGDRVLTSDGNAQPLTWIGTTTIVPSSKDLPQVPLYRISPDAFGLGRPLSHLVAGPSARILGAGQQTLTPISTFEDGVNVTRLSLPSPLDLYHICLQEHGLLRMGGLEFESYHPGHGALRDVGPAMRTLFMKLFPQIGHVTDFGLMKHPRDPDPATDVNAA